jgi:transposase InsO family protein
MDLTTHPLWDYSMRYVLVTMELRSRKVVHVAVTASPSLAWLKQRIREATPFGFGPRFLVHDNDGIFGQFGSRGLGRTGRSYRSALDLWLGEEDHLRRTVTAFITYYNAGRPHQGIEGIPEYGPASPRTPAPTSGERPIKVAAHPVLGGLHHDYRRAA